MTSPTETSGSLPPRPRGAAFERRVEVDAPAAVVWQVLEDVGGWGDWNPVYPEARGSLQAGGSIALTVAIPGMKPQSFSAKVLQTIPGRALQFGAPALGGLLFATRYIELQPTGPHGCRVVNGEALRGLLGPLFARGAGGAIGRGLERQNEALKSVAEARARRPG